MGRFRVTQPGPLSQSVSVGYQQPEKYIILWVFQLGLQGAEHEEWEALRSEEIRR